MDRASWPALKKRVAKIIISKTRDEWREIMEGTDVCFAPVLNMIEAPEHPHLKSRNTFLEIAGVTQPGPAPRFSRTIPEIIHFPPHPGQHTDEALQRWGFAKDEITKLRQSNAVA
jgi:alpha-methylacyl-CoA racemase